MELFVVLLLAYGVWASERSSNTSVFSNTAISLRSAGRTSCRPNCKEADTYWVRYDGRIPKDAVDAGDISNIATMGKLFIGQGFVETVGLLPGPLYAGSCILQVCENWNEYFLCDNVMILCAKRKLNVRWIKINVEQIPCLQSIPGIKLIDGGFQHNVTVYIGRHIHDSVRLVGKVHPQSGLALMNNNKIICVFKNFEILVYLPLDYSENSC